MKKIVLVVDMQYDFIDFPNSSLPIPGSKAIIGPMTDYLRGLTVEDTAAVVFTLDSHELVPYLNSDEGKMFPPHCIKGTLGHQLVVDETVVNGEIPMFRMHKNFFSMWEEEDPQIIWHGFPRRDTQYGPTRDRLFSKQNFDKEIVVMGLALNVCVKAAIMGLVERGFKVTLMTALTLGIGEGPDAMDPATIFAKEIAEGKVTLA